MQTGKTWQVNIGIPIDGKKKKKKSLKLEFNSKALAIG